MESKGFENIFFSKTIAHSYMQANMFANLVHAFRDFKLGNIFFTKAFEAKMSLIE